MCAHTSPGQAVTICVRTKCLGRHLRSPPSTRGRVLPLHIRDYDYSVLGSAAVVFRSLRRNRQLFHVRRFFV